MATLAKTYTFSPGTGIVSAEVNTDFDQIIEFVNNSVVHTDGSKAFTAVPTGPATDPSNDNQFTRKKYVDDRTGIRSYRRQTSPSLYSGTSSTDLGISLPSFTMPDLGGNRALRLNLSVPWTEVTALGGTHWSVNATTAELWFYDNTSTTFLVKRRFSPSITELSDDTGAGLDFTCWFVDNSDFAIGATMAIDLRGRLTGGGKFRLGCSTDNPLWMTAEVV